MKEEVTRKHVYLGCKDLSRQEEGCLLFNFLFLCFSFLAEVGDDEDKSVLVETGSDAADVSGLRLRRRVQFK